MTPYALNAAYQDMDRLRFKRSVTGISGWKVVVASDRGFCPAMGRFGGHSSICETTHPPIEIVLVLSHSS